MAHYLPPLVSPQVYWVTANKENIFKEKYTNTKRLNFTFDIPLSRRSWAIQVEFGLIASVACIHNHWKRTIMFNVFENVAQNCVRCALCCPVLKPHMTGDPDPLGFVMEKVSVRQSPTEPPLLNEYAVPASAVPVWGPASSKVWRMVWCLKKQEILFFNWAKTRFDALFILTKVNNRTVKLSP